MGIGLLIINFNAKKLIIVHSRMKSLYQMYKTVNTCLNFLGFMKATQLKDVSMYDPLWENQPNCLFIKVFSSLRAPICGATLSK